MRLTLLNTLFQIWVSFTKLLPTYFPNSRIHILLYYLFDLYYLKPIFESLQLIYSLQISIKNINRHL